MNRSRLRLEFAPRARSGSAVGRFVLGAAVLLVALEVVPIGIGLATRQHDLDALAELDARPAGSSKGRAPAAKSDASYVTKVRYAQQAAQNLTTPWADLLGALESAPQQSIALLAIEPSSSKKTFHLTAEARDPKAMLAYLEALRKDRRLDNVVLVSHQLQVQSPGRPIRFQLEAGWGQAQ